MAMAQELAERDVRAFNEQDIEAKLGISSPDLELVVPGASFHGVDEMEAFARGLWEAFPDARITIERRVAEGSLAVVEGTFTATHAGTFRGPGGEMAATGRRVQLSCALVYQVDVDRIASKHFHFDRLELLSQIGAMPAPAEA